MTPPDRHTIGRRGTCLLIFGSIWILQGIGIIRHHSVTGFWSFDHIPWQARAAAWLATGAIAYACAFRRQGRDAIGWTGLYVMAAWVVFAILDIAWETWRAGHGGVLDVIQSGLGNFALLALIFVTSGWREGHDGQGKS